MVLFWTFQHLWVILWFQFLLYFFILSVQIQQLHDMEEVCYDKVLEQIRAGHQVSLHRYIFYLLSCPACLSWRGWLQEWMLMRKASFNYFHLGGSASNAQVMTNERWWMWPVTSLLCIYLYISLANTFFFLSNTGWWKEVELSTSPASPL